MVQDDHFFRPKAYSCTSRGGKMGKHKAKASSMGALAFESVAIYSFSK